LIFLPHTCSMETNKNGFGDSRAVRPPQRRNSGIVLSPTEAEEYCEFKRQKRIAEVEAALTKAELYAAGRETFPAEIRKIADGAKKVGAAAVRVSPLYASFVRNVLQGSSVVVDCIVGGTGETTVKVKAYEAKQSRRAGAKEITLILSHSALKSGRSGDVKREIKKVCRAARKCMVKVNADKSTTYPELLRVARLAADCGAKYLSVEFFPDCGRLKRDLHDVCMLEIRGVETAVDYKSLIAAGVERIGTSHAEEIYSELMREAENTSFSVAFSESVTVVPPSSAPSAPLSVVSEESREASVAPSLTAVKDTTIAGREKQNETGRVAMNGGNENRKTALKAEQMSVLNDKKMLGGNRLK